MKKSLLAMVSVFCAASLTVAGCAKAPDAEPPAKDPSPSAAATQSETAEATTEAPANPDFKACMVSDDGGFDDKSFNETSHNGLKRAASELGIKTADIESHRQADFPGNIQKMVDEKCDIIVTVGFLLSQATIDAAKKYPDIKFAIVDDPVDAGVPNHRNMVFNTAESSFLAGYLAAAMTKTGRVGTYGGMKIPTVTIFMDGYAQGVEYYNEQKGKDVKVIGWDVKTQDGQILESFNDQTKAKATSNTLKSQGVDIIFPVAGPAGLGALAVAGESGGKVNVIWVDTDGYISLPEKDRPYVMSSVAKKMDEAVFETIKSAYEGKFNNDPYVGTLENGGTELSPFHDFEDKVSDEIKADLEKIKADIIAGEIKIVSEAQPK